MTGSAGRLGDSARADRRAGIAGRNDTMFAVAVRANGRINLTARYQLSVNPFPKVLLYIVVTLAAGFRDVEVINR